MEYHGFSYAALDLRAYPGSTKLYCQNYYLPLPTGWSIAPDDSDSIAVVASYVWGANVMVLQGGASYRTNYYGAAGDYSAGKPFTWSESLLLHDTSTNRYRVTGCSLRILLKYASGTVSPCTMTIWPTTLLFLLH